MPEFQKPGFQTQAQATFTATNGSTKTAIAGTTTADFIKVSAVYATAAAAMEITFVANSTKLFAVHTGVGGGLPAVAPRGEYLFETATTHPMIVTSSTDGGVFALILYQRST